MELTYQNPMMPASYTAISEDEMTYIGGGFQIDLTPEKVGTFIFNLGANFINMMGKAAFTGAIGGLVLMHNDGMTISQSVSYYWEGQTNAGKVATVVVGGFAGLYAYRRAMSIYATVKSLYNDLKNAYELAKAQQAQTAAQQDIGITDPIVAAAA